MPLGMLLSANAATSNGRHSMAVFRLREILPGTDRRRIAAFSLPWPPFTGYLVVPGGRPREVGDVREMARDHTEEAVETLVDPIHHAKSDAARGAAAQALLDRGYGKSVAVSMDIVDEGQAHLEALQELADRRQRINREKTPAEAT